MKKILLAIIAITALIPLAPARAEGRSYAGQTDGALVVCPTDTTLPCVNGAIFSRGGGTYTVSVNDDVAGLAGQPVPFEAQAIHPLDVTGAVPGTFPPRVIVRACGSTQITAPAGYDRVSVFLRWARPGVNTTDGAVTPNGCIQQNKTFLPPTSGSISVTP